MNRRTFSKTLGMGLMALATGLSSMTLGCNAIEDLRAWIPVALSGLAGILKVLNITGNPIVTLIQAAFSALLATITNYQSGTGTLSDIENGISDVETQFANFFQQVAVPAGLLNIVEGLAGVILSTISAFAAEINPQPTLVSSTFKMGKRSIPFTPKKRSVRQFRKAYNQIAVANGHPEIQI